MEHTHKPYSVKDRLSRTRHYMGGYWTFLATGKETNGQFALIEINLRKGIEPPGHTHTKEDESYSVMEGEIEFTVGDEVHLLKAGDFIHLPKDIFHKFKLQSDKAKVLMHLVPAGLDEFFMELSKHADVLDYPAVTPGLHRLN